MNRTPRSARRRASRQFAANVPGLRASGPYSSKRARRLLRHVRQLRHRACIRNAISYCAMRVAISGSPILLQLRLIQLRRDRRGIAPRVSCISPAGSKGTAPDRPPNGTSRPGTGSAEIRCPTAGRRAAGRRLPPVRHHDDERRQVLVLAAQAVRQPRPDARTAGKLEAGLEERDAGIVVDRLGVHGPDEARSSATLRRVRQQFADPCPGLPVLRELERSTARPERSPARPSCR